MFHARAAAFTTKGLPGFATMRQVVAAPAKVASRGSTFRGLADVFGRAALLPFSKCHTGGRDQTQSASDLSGGAYIGPYMTQTPSFNSPEASGMMTLPRDLLSGGSSHLYCEFAPKYDGTQDIKSWNLNFTTASPELMVSHRENYRLWLR